MLWILQLVAEMYLNVCCFLGTWVWVLCLKRWDFQHLKMCVSPVQAKSGVEVESTEIALAFPLASKTQRFHSQVGSVCVKPVTHC